jgi:hypothetical protein
VLHRGVLLFAVQAVSGRSPEANEAARSEDEQAIPS